MDILVAMDQSDDYQPPFANHQDLLDTIDATPNGSVPWDSFTVNYCGPLPDDPPPWMLEEHEVWFRDAKQVIEIMLANRDYDGEFDYVPYKDFDEEGNRRYKDMLSGDWVWNQAVSTPCVFVILLFLNVSKDFIADDEEIDSEGCMLTPIVLGSDKTTVSVATGQNEYYPLYISIANVRNNVRRAHRGAVVVLAFLAIPKGMAFYY